MNVAAERSVPTIVEVKLPLPTIKVSELNWVPSQVEATTDVMVVGRVAVVVKTMLDASTREGSDGVGDGEPESVPVAPIPDGLVDSIGEAVVVVVRAEVATVVVVRAEVAVVTGETVAAVVGMMVAVPSRMLAV
jgi:hypothetical protein